MESITITDVLIAISENWAWLGRFVSGNDDEKNAVIDEVLAHLGGDQESISPEDRQAILDQNFAYIQGALESDGKNAHLRPHIHVC